MVSNKRAPGNGGTLLLIAGEPQSRLFFRCGPIGFLNRDYSNGGGVLVSQRPTLMKKTQINPVCTRQSVVSFIDSPKCWDIEILPPAAERIQFAFNRVQVELCGPQRESHRLFPLKPCPTLSFISIRENWADCSDAQQSAGDTCQRWLAAGEMRQWPCNWPWLHIIDSSNRTTMGSTFWCRSSYNFFAPLNWLSGKLNCGALWVTGPHILKGTQPTQPLDGTPFFLKLRA